MFGVLGSIHLPCGNFPHAEFFSALQKFCAGVRGVQRGRGAAEIGCGNCIPSLIINSIKYIDKVMYRLVPYILDRLTEGGQ